MHPRMARLPVALAADAVVSFHALVVGEARPELAPERFRTDRSLRLMPDA